MTTPTTGRISFTDISTEFGLPSGKNLGAYRVSQTIGDRAWPLDTGVPTTGTIRFSDLHGKTCNVVVDYTGGEVLSSASAGSSAQSSNVNHVFNDDTNTTISLTSAAGITVSTQGDADPNLPDGVADESISFTVSRNSTLLSSSASTFISHSFNDTTNQDISLTSTNPSVTIVSESKTDPDGLTPFDITDRKHYTITFSDGAILGDATASGVTVSDIVQQTGSGIARVMVVSKTEKISATQIKVWFQNITGTPVGNSYVQGFNLSWSVQNPILSTNTVTMSNLAQPVISFSRNSNGSETVSKTIKPNISYIVTSPSPGATLRVTSGGSQLELDDADVDTDPNTTFNDLIINASQGTFYSLSFPDGSTEFRYIKTTGGTFNTLNNKHYIISFTDGTVVLDQNASNIEVFSTSNITASGVRRDAISVAKKEKIDNSSFRVWFANQSFITFTPPTYQTGSNTFAREFLVSWAAPAPNGALASAKDSYDSSGVVVGGFRSRPGSGQTKKVYHLIRRRIGNGFGTGVWDSSTVSLEFRITGDGAIIGRGGNGGYGAGGGGYSTGSKPAEDYQTGKSGYPALYANYPCSVILEASTARLQAGGGGGGGGGGACCNPDNNPQDPVTGGAGGGGGAGLPAGRAGNGARNDGAGYGNTDGNSGTLNAGGRGGNGGSTNGVQGPRNCAGGGGGGGGGGPTAGPGGTGFVERCGNTELNGEAGRTNRGGDGSRGLACGGDGYRQGGPGGAHGYRVSADPGIVVNVSNPGNGILFGRQ